MKLGNESPLDELDWKIIVALQEARLSMAALGRKIGLSPPATTERVRRLEERKIIRAYRAEIGLDRVGLGVEPLSESRLPARGSIKRHVLSVPSLKCSNVTVRPEETVLS
jgi:Lrp/AsnC family leucine-responsive transcriptional regulator